MNKLLINEPPLQVLPTLAKRIGLNEALFIQQLHYWLGNPKMGREFEGRRWIRNTVAEWHKDNFPFWSERTIMRLIASLEDSGFLLARNDLNVHKYDRTKWYTINYDSLNEVALTEIDASIVTSCQDGTGQDGNKENAELSVTIPETTSETTPESEEAPPDKLDSSTDKVAGDYLADVVRLQGKTKETTATDPVDQWFVYRNKFLETFKRRMGRYPDEGTEKETIVELAAEATADCEVWDKSFRVSILNWSGSNKPPLARVIEVYRCVGDYEKWRQKKYGGDSVGDIGADIVEETIIIKDINGQTETKTIRQ